MPYVIKIKRAVFIIQRKTLAVTFVQTFLFIERQKKLALKKFGPRTWCTKKLSIFKSYTTDTV